MLDFGQHNVANNININIKRQRGFSITWDVTVTTLEDSHISASASSDSVAAEMAASSKQVKNAAFSGSHMFQPIALEIRGPVSESAVQFLNDLGHSITSVFADKEGQFHFQRLSLSCCMCRSTTT